jgi:hypothetical protein
LLRSAIAEVDAGGVSEPLLARFRHRESNAGGWTGRFSELTLGYPGLQMRGLTPARPGVAGCGGVAHAMLLVYAFLDDRDCDGQQPLAVPERAFVDRLLDCGMDRLRAVAERAGSIEDELDALVDEYRRGLAARYPDAVPGGTIDRVAGPIAASRACLGYAATLALSAAQGLDAQTRATLREAYDNLVVALQWLDDIEDWREDLETGDENLLFCLLRDAGLPVESHEKNRFLIPDVGHALNETGALDHAFEAARQRLAHADRLQAALPFGAVRPHLAGMAATIPSAEHRIRLRIQHEVTGAFGEYLLARAGLH